MFVNPTHQLACMVNIRFRPYISFHIGLIVGVFFIHLYKFVSYEKRIIVVHVIEIAGVSGGYDWFTEIH